MQKSRLDGRVQKVVVNGTYAACRAAISGVVPGSVLGPVPLDIFISDLEEMRDSSGLKSAGTQSQVRAAVQRDLTRLEE